MKLIKVAAATLNQTPLAWEKNRTNILHAIAEARARGASVLCLPELCITGYGCEDGFLSPAVQRTALEVLQEIVPETANMIVSLGLPMTVNKASYNTCCLAADGKILGFAAKRALAGDGIHYEPRWFKPWPRAERTRIRIGRDTYPIGDLVFDCGGVRIGFEICEDAWIAERPGVTLSLDAADIILNPSASHFAFGKQKIRKRLVLEGSRAFGVSYVYANLLGNEAGRAIYDGDAMIATAGELVAKAPRFSFADRELITATVDVELTRSRHGRLSSYRPKIDFQPGECVVAPFDFPKLTLERPKLESVAWEESRQIKAEELARAVSLSLFDYMRKSRSRGFVLSLSGGADSAAVACLVGLMVRFAVAKLGIAGVKQRLDYLDLTEVDTEAQLVEHLLLTAYQSTRNSSETTRAAAATVAHTLGAKHVELDVDPLVEGYVRAVSGVLGRELSWETDDLALQNIQARVRAPSVWLFANLRGALLLSTSNRSEAAVGYATMDGDTSGGLSPIAGVDKAYVLTWLRWLEKEGPHGIGPMPALSVITAQAPTAELRPKEAAQTDETDLMPYALLDAIERAAIRDKRAPLDVYQIMRVDFPEYAPLQLLHWVERFFRLWSRNQWKRERYAPSFHVDDANLDPKTWCRFPILSGGFERELSELRRYVDGALCDRQK